MRDDLPDTIAAPDATQAQPTATPPETAPGVPEYVPPTYDPNATTTSDTAQTDPGESQVASEEAETFSGVPTTTPTIPKTEEFKESFLQGAEQGIPANLYKGLSILEDQYLVNSPVANQDQLDGFKQDRPGLEFPENSTIQTALDMTNDYDTDRTRDQILSYSPSTIGGSIAGFSGAMAGAILTDPISVGFAEGAGAVNASRLAIPELLGLGSPTFNTAGEVVRASGGVSAAYRVLQGATEGAAFGVAQEASNSINDISSGDSLDPIDAMKNIGINAFLGGVIHPIGGFVGDRFKPVVDNVKGFDDDLARDATQSSANMMANGMDPDPSFSLRNGFNNASRQFKDMLDDNKITPDEMFSELDAADEKTQAAVSDSRLAFEKVRGDIESSGFTIDDVRQMNQQLRDAAERPLPTLTPAEIDQLRTQDAPFISQQQALDIQSFLKQVDPNLISSQRLQQAGRLLGIEKSRIQQLRQPILDQLKQHEDAVAQQTMQSDAITKTQELRNKFGGTDNLQDIIDAHDTAQDRLAFDINTNRSVAVRKALLRNTEEVIPKEVMDSYIRKLKSSDSDFANGRGQENLDATGPEFKSPEDLLERRFPDSEQKRIIEDSDFTAEEQKEWDEINNSKTKISAMKKAFTDLIGCASRMI